MASMSNEHYRHSILPLGLFFVVAGLIIAIGGLVLPDEKIFLPGIDSAIARRVFVCVWGAMGPILGIGYILRQRWAWIASVVFAGLGALVAGGCIWSHNHRRPITPRCWQP